MGGTADLDSGRDPEEMFCLKWNDYQENVVATLSELRAEEDFFDVTLAVDGEQVRAHKLVLSACSAFFRRLLRMNPGPNPVIVLWDVAYNDLLNIVDFMYNGEVKVRQANIQSFLAVAEKFRVRGLCLNENNGPSGKASPKPAPKSPKISSKRNVSPERLSAPSTSEAKRPRNESDARDEEEARSPLTPDVSIREESQFSNAGSASRDHHRGSTEFSDWQGSDQGEGAAGCDDRNPGLQAALMGMGMGSLLDQEAAKEFLRRAAALGVNPAAMAAAAAQTSSSSVPPPGSSGGGSVSMQSAGSPSDPGLRRPRSVYNSQQVAQLEAYFRFNEYIDGERKRRLSQITNIPEHQIKVWFQNRRQKKKREEAEIVQNSSGIRRDDDMQNSSGKSDTLREFKQEDDYAATQNDGIDISVGAIDDEDEPDEGKDPISAAYRQS